MLNMFNYFLANKTRTSPLCMYCMSSDSVVLETTVFRYFLNWTAIKITGISLAMNTEYQV